MICPQCKEQGLTSRVYPHGRSSTLMAVDTYYDEEGKWHCHDPNTTTESYGCSKGHCWSENYKPKCASCDPTDPSSDCI